MLALVSSYIKRVGVVRKELLGAYVGAGKVSRGYVVRLKAPTEEEKHSMLVVISPQCLGVAWQSLVLNPWMRMFLEM